MAIYFPPPPPFTGGCQPQAPRRLPPDLLANSQFCFGVDSVNSGFSGATFNKNALPTGLTPGSMSPSIAGSATQNLFAITPTDNPGVIGRSSNYNLSVNVSSGNANIFGSFAIVRTDSAGNFLNQSVFTAEQALTTGLKVFSLSNIDLGSWAVGDRLLFALNMRNNDVGTQGLTVTLGDSITKGCAAPVALPHIPPDLANGQTYGTILTSWREPPPHAYFGARQALEGRKLSPGIPGQSVDRPPVRSPSREPRRHEPVTASQPNPWTYSFQGATQIFARRKLAPALSAVREDDPPFALRSGTARTPQAAIIASLAQPDPWTYSFLGGRQPLEPRKAPPYLIATPADDPPFAHFGRAGTMAETLSLAQPNPWSGTFTGGRHPYGQRKLFPPALGVAIDNPPFAHRARTAAHHAIIRTWEPPPPFPLKNLYDRSHVVQIRRVTGRGFILTWGARQAPVNYPPVTFGGPVNATMADIWSVMFASNWTYTFGEARQPYGKRITVIN